MSLNQPPPRSPRRVILLAACTLLWSVASPSIGQGSKSRWTFDLGDTSPLCVQIRKRLNSYSWDLASGRTRERCSYLVVASDPSASELPWRDLDVRANLGLLIKAKRYLQLGPHAYFDSDLRQSPETETSFRIDAELFINEGGRMQIWTGRLVSLFTDRMTAARPGDQTILQFMRPIRHSAGDKTCSGMPDLQWQISTVMISADLKDIDSAEDLGAFAVLSHGAVRLYHDRPYIFLQTSVFRDSEIGLTPVCSFASRKGSNVW